MAKTPNLQDFNPDDIAKTSDVNDLSARIGKIEEQLKSADKVGELLATAFQASSSLRATVSAALLACLDNVDNREKLEGIIAKIDRKTGWATLKRYGKYLIGALLFIAGAVFTALINKIFGTT